MADESEHWISASAAINLLKNSMGRTTAEMTIAARANDGVIRSRAARFMRGARVEHNVELPEQFWWARGDAALEQNWVTGDFETWIDHEEHWRAYGVQFLRSDIDVMVPEEEAVAMTAPRS